MSMITEQVEYLIKLSNKHPFDSNIPTLQRACKEAADTIEQLAAKVREDNAYQKAFEDIKAEIRQKAGIEIVDGCVMVREYEVEAIIDKYRQEG